MENASKALLIAASVLIGLLIISLAVYLFITFGTQSAQMHRQIDENRLGEFNSQFTSYEGKDGLTIYDVITVANLATENNKYYEFKSRGKYENKGLDYYITVILEDQNIGYGNDKNTTDINNEYNNLIDRDINKINENNSNLKQYECQSASVSKTTGRVYEVIFKEKK